MCMSVTLGIVAINNSQLAVACYAFTMAGALLGSVPVALVYSFFVEYYVTGLTGSVKG